MQPRESELAPESILPAQLSDRPFGGARVQPEKRLQVAVLADAVLTFHRWAGDEGARARRLFVEVETWFASDEADSPFTFMAICDSLKFDPIYGALEAGARTSKPPSNQRDPFVVTAMGRSIGWCSHGSGESHRFAMLSESDQPVPEVAGGDAGVGVLRCDYALARGFRISGQPGSSAAATLKRPLRCSCRPVR
jgi:hypothetical protein